MADSTAASEEKLGRRARKPWKLGKRGWKRTLSRTRAQIKEDNLTIVAAGSAFFMFLAIFPGLVALIALYGLFTDPADVDRHVAALSGVLPATAADVLREQMQRLAATASTELGFGVALGIVVALWSANKGMKAMVKALNIAYDEKEERNIFELYGVTLGLTFFGILFLAVLLFLVAIIPGLLGNLRLGEGAQTAMNWLRWPVLALVLIGGLAVLYHYGPDRSSPQWSWVTPGALLAVIVFLLASALFSLYVSMFGDYNETYGSVGAIAILMLWLYIGAWAVLLGAELNSEAERQTMRDTTEGEPKPMGQRGAYAADTLG
jgi:membrane protein